MSLISRRQILKRFLSLGSVPALGLLSGLNLFNFGSYYSVSYRCKKNNEFQQTTYLDARNKWGNVEKIKSISERFSKEKQLLSFSFSETKNELSWNYVFSSQSSFNKWNDEVFYSGAFNSLKVEPEFAFSIEQKYIASLPTNTDLFKA